MIAMGFRRRSRGANRCGPRHHCPRRRRRRSRRGQHADIEQFDVVLRFDGLIVETADLTKKSPEEVEKNPAQTRSGRSQLHRESLETRQGKRLLRRRAEFPELLLLRETPNPLAEQVEYDGQRHPALGDATPSLMALPRTALPTTRSVLRASSSRPGAFCWPGC